MPGKSMVADVVSLGYLPLRHEDSNVDTSLRIVTFGCRVGGPTNGGIKGLDQYGIPVGETTANGGSDDTYGDLCCWNFWKKNTRTIGGWAQVWPAQITSVVSTTYKAQPTWKTDFSKDTRFAERQIFVDTNYLPGVGDKGIVISGTHEDAQQDLFLPTQPGSWVYDTNWFTYDNTAATVPFSKKNALRLVDDPLGASGNGTAMDNPIECQNGCFIVSRHRSTPAASGLGGKYIAIGQDPNDTINTANSLFAITFQDKGAGQKSQSVGNGITGFPDAVFSIQGGNNTGAVYLDAGGVTTPATYGKCHVEIANGSFIVKSDSVGSTGTIDLNATHDAGGTGAHISLTSAHTGGHSIVALDTAGSGTGAITCHDTNGTQIETASSGKVGFYGTTPTSRATVTGSCGLSTVGATIPAISNLMNALNALGIVINSTTP